MSRARRFACGLGLALLASLPARAQSEPFLAQLMLTGANYCPQGWAPAEGQLLPIAQNQALFALLGTTYGGNGQTTFALPDLRGRAAFHLGGGLIQGQAGGEVAHTLTISEMPQHIHFGNAATSDGDVPTATGNMLGAFNNGYGGAVALTSLLPASISNVGGSQPHENMSPYLVLNYVIALIGIFPSQN